MKFLLIEQEERGYGYSDEVIKSYITKIVPQKDDRIFLSSKRVFVVSYKVFKSSQHGMCHALVIGKISNY